MTGKGAVVNALLAYRRLVIQSVVKDLACKEWVYSRFFLPSVV